MQRREFLGVLGGVAVAWPRAIHAQEAGRIYGLGIMTPSLKIAASPILAFFDELRVVGFVEGQNLKGDGGGFMVCATSNFPCIHRALTEGVICRRALE
jgi:putative tryptophan/tyrosine transport system substrate-binding protein